MPYYYDDDDDGGMLYGQVDDATLQEVEAVVNVDVEMLSPPVNMRYMVVDTNIFINYLDILQVFVEDCERTNAPVVVVVPGIVISELDGQKNSRNQERQQLAWSARRASTWLLEKVRGKDPRDARERRWVKGQTHEETMMSSGKWNIRPAGHMPDASPNEVNDALIIDCCEYFSIFMCQKSGYLVTLCSEDKNLCLTWSSRGLTGDQSLPYPTAAPARGWSSRAIAREVFGLHTEDPTLLLFDDHSSKFTRQAAANGQPTQETPPPRAADPDAMDIDGIVEEEPAQYSSSDLLNMLHVQIIDHFTERLRELVKRVGGNEIPVDKIFTSMHAPLWQKKLLQEWSAQECIDYLKQSKKKKGEMPLVGKLLGFFQKPYQKYDGVVGRTGQEWPRVRWTECEDTLEKIGECFEDQSMLTSVQSLRLYSEEIWLRRQRPAGM